MRGEYGTQRKPGEEIRAGITPELDGDVCNKEEKIC